MARRLAVVLLFAVIALAGISRIHSATQSAAATEPAPLIPDAFPGAKLLSGMGTHHHPITTRVPEVQRWFDQALILTFGFNHDAAERSFLSAAQLDPDCAMCWWGAALVLGPHVNAGMDPANAGTAWARLQKARSLMDQASPRERDYIEALTARYSEQPPTDRRALDEAYAAAMEKLAGKYPDDLDAAAFHAEALMDLQPWDYYDAAGNPKGGTPKIVTVLESIIARNPDHPGALHLYIHAVEASKDPDRGARAADRLRELVPGAGHLVHMPGHIYARVGRYHDAVIANQKAIASDNAYLALCSAKGIYPFGYVPHNHHFLWFAASMAGASKVALAAAQETGRRSDLPDTMRERDFVALQNYWMTPLLADVRFGRWHLITAMPKPPQDLPYAIGLWHYAQGMAAVRQKRSDDAQKHLDALAKIAADPAIEALIVWDRYSLAGGMRVAERVLTGELAAAHGEFDRAVKALEEGIAIEDSLPYDEPPPWHAPVRHNLGAVLLAADRAADAQAVYEQDLQRNRDNGWSLYGLNQALRAQGKDAEAAEVRQRFEAAWRHADVKLAASRF